MGTHPGTFYASPAIHEQILVTNLTYQFYTSKLFSGQCKVFSLIISGDIKIGSKIKFCKEVHMLFNK